jgi:phosphate starvation-inducible protein PhoH
MEANTLDNIEDDLQRRLTKREKRMARQNGGGIVLKAQTMKLKKVEPLTLNQKATFKAFDEGSHLFLHGIAGTGKTFISMYLALRELLGEFAQQNKIYIVRSVVPTRDMGFLPGSPKEKSRVYEQPYMAMCAELFNRGDAYEVLKNKNAIEFMTTSFIRGITINDAIIIVDECQNMSDGELHSIMTRVGQNCRIVFCGDIAQDDLSSDRRREYSGVREFMRIIKNMKHFDFVEFGIGDIVRSNIVKEYIIARHQLGIS